MPKLPEVPKKSYVFVFFPETGQLPLDSKVYTKTLPSVDSGFAHKKAWNMAKHFSYLYGGAWYYQLESIDGSFVQDSESVLVPSSKDRRAA